MNASSVLSKASHHARKFSFDPCHPREFTTVSLSLLPSRCSTRSPKLFLRALSSFNYRCSSADTRCYHKSIVFSTRSFGSAVPLDHEKIRHESSHQNDSNELDSTMRLSKKSPPRNPIPDFDNAQLAYETMSTPELIRAAISFSTCRIPVLVHHAESLLRWSRRFLGDKISDYVLKATLFGHFCAGEDEVAIQPKITALERAGVGSILDFAAEDDGCHTSNSKSTNKNDNVDVFKQHRSYQARMYDYESESNCDRHLQDFLKCIRDVASFSKDGYAAVKMTALGNPKLLERMSRAIVEAQNLFAKFDQNADGLVSRDEFERGFYHFFKDDKQKLNDMLEHLDFNLDGRIDYISWSMLLTPRDLRNITVACREQGPLSLAAPTDEEVELIEKIYERGRVLAKEATHHGTRLLIDAEQMRFQPAIDNIVLELQRTYNATTESDFPIIYNTYQCYLKDAPMRLRTDVERSERFRYHFGAKLVRGAYMESERALAAKLGYPSPIFETIEDTHKCYNDSVQYLLRHAKKSDKQVELMIASHNQESIEKAIEVMNEIGIDRHAKTIAFGQLYGMSDNLTFILGKHGYRAYKYVPYGEVKMVMPYLIRRANENSSIAGRTKNDLAMIFSELKRRVFGGKHLRE